MSKFRTIVCITALVSSTNGFAIETESLGVLTPEVLVKSLVCGISTSNVTYTGANIAAGTFENAISNGFGIDEGIMLSSGAIADAKPPNDSDAKTTVNGLPGDADLDVILSNYTTYDASVLEFDFTLPTETSFEFRYAFGSEEYNEYVNSSFNDVFAFFLDGNNIALLPDNMTPVSINTINNGMNAAFYKDNDPSDLGSPTPYSNQFDGLTTVLLAKATVGSGAHHMKLAIADAGDHAFDSAVFLEGSSFGIVSCKLYGVHDEGVRNSQFFNIDDTLPFSFMDSNNGYDLEALDAHPISKTLFAASGNKATSGTPGYIYPITTEGVVGVGVPIQYEGSSQVVVDVSGLSFNPSTNSLWGWEQGKGLFLIEEDIVDSLPPVLMAQLKWKSDGLHVGDLTWNQAGNGLYLANGNVLLKYNDSTDKPESVCGFSPKQEIESLEMTSQGKLLVGIHDDSMIYEVNLDNCDLTPAFELLTDVNDVEGMAYVCITENLCND